MDLATLTNAPREFELGGETFLVSTLRLKDWGAVQAWIKDKVPGPVAMLDSAAMGRLSPGHQRQLLEIALREQRNWPPRVGSGAWFDVLDHDGGPAKFLEVVLSRHQPFTAAQAAALADRLTTSDVVPLIVRALGFEAGPEGPKAEAPGAGPTPA